MTFNKNSNLFNDDNQKDNIIVCEVIDDIIDNVIDDILDNVIEKICYDDLLSRRSLEIPKWCYREINKFKKKHYELESIDNYGFDFDCLIKFMQPKNKPYEEIMITGLFDVTLKNNKLITKVTVKWLSYNYFDEGVIFNEPEITTLDGDLCVCLKNHTWFVVTKSQTIKDMNTCKIMRAAKQCGDTEYIYKTLMKVNRELISNHHDDLTKVADFWNNFTKTLIDNKYNNLITINTQNNIIKKLYFYMGFILLSLVVFGYSFVINIY